MVIYVITAIEDRGHHDKHTVAWYSTLDTAIKAVLVNSGDMNEGRTNVWVVIEETPEGNPYRTVEHWFKWVAGKYQPSNKPAFSNGIVNWGIG